MSRLSKGLTRALLIVVFLCGVVLCSTLILRARIEGHHFDCYGVVHSLKTAFLCPFWALRSFLFTYPVWATVLGVMSVVAIAFGITRQSVVPFVIVLCILSVAWTALVCVRYLVFELHWCE